MCIENIHIPILHVSPKDIWLVGKYFESWGHGAYPLEYQYSDSTYIGGHVLAMRAYFAAMYEIWSRRQWDHKWQDQQPPPHSSLTDRWWQFFQIKFHSHSRNVGTSQGQYVYSWTPIYSL
jgi:hypothetical protein